MSKFINLSIQGKPDESVIFDDLVKRYPSFLWRRGDSDQIGPYVSGMDSNYFQVKIFLGEYPVDVSISFPNDSGAVMSPKDEDFFVEEFKDFLSKYGNVF